MQPICQFCQYESENGHAPTCGNYVEPINPMSTQVEFHIKKQFKKQPTPMGASEWKDHGEKYGYLNYFGFVLKKDLLDKIDKKLYSLQQESGKQDGTNTKNIGVRINELNWVKNLIHENGENL